MSLFDKVKGFINSPDDEYYDEEEENTQQEEAQEPIYSSRSSSRNMDPDDDRLTFPKRATRWSISMPPLSFRWCWSNQSILRMPVLWLTT